jgi:hypothetical protein
LALNDLTAPAAVRSAVAEFDSVGRATFLQKHGFRPARDYFLVVKERRYDSKAIAGVAHGYQFPGRGALRPAEFSGGCCQTNAKFAEIRRHSRFSSQSFQPGAPPLFTRQLQAQSCRRACRVASARRGLNSTVRGELRLVCVSLTAPIVAQIRNAANRPKARKDLDQARDLIQVIAVDRPYNLQDAYDAAMESGPKWRATITRSLKQRLDIADMMPFAE